MTLVFSVSSSISFFFAAGICTVSKISTVNLGAQ